MLHLVCACGAPVSVVPKPGGGTAPCPACGAPVAYPDASSVGAATATSPPRAAASGPPPVPVVASGGPAAAGEAPHVVPELGHDERLDLLALEAEAARAGLYAGLSLTGGILLGVILLLAGPDGPASLRAALAAGAALGGLVLAAALRASRRACLAAAALAARERDLARAVARG